MNNILDSNKFLKLWRKSKVIAILRSAKDSSLPNSYKLIFFLCHPYKLHERMILNRMNLLQSTLLLKSNQDLEL